ncbi:hypothetical protein DFJ73DRAFT_757602 [Zopfochytrium polystomum]|nr:hypothetical protein DFJ73DRAFT_757602 [Zopfochytrium polystomum]
MVFPLDLRASFSFAVAGLLALFASAAAIIAVGPASGIPPSLGADGRSTPPANTSPAPTSGYDARFAWGSALAEYTLATASAWLYARNKQRSFRRLFLLARRRDAIAASVDLEKASSVAAAVAARDRPRSRRLRADLAVARRALEALDFDASAQLSADVSVGAGCVRGVETGEVMVTIGSLGGGEEAEATVRPATARPETAPELLHRVHFVSPSRSASGRRTNLEVVPRDPSHHILKPLGNPVPERPTCRHGLPPWNAATSNPRHVLAAADFVLTAATLALVNLITSILDHMDRVRIEGARLDSTVLTARLLAMLVPRKQPAYLVATVILMAQSNVLPARSFIAWGISVLFLAAAHVPLVIAWGGDFDQRMPWGMCAQVAVLLVALAALVRFADAVAREGYEALHAMAAERLPLRNPDHGLEAGGQSKSLTSFYNLYNVDAGGNVADVPAGTPPQSYRISGRILRSMESLLAILSARAHDPRQPHEDRQPKSPTIQKLDGLLDTCNRWIAEAGLGHGAVDSDGRPLLGLDAAAAEDAAGDEAEIDDRRSSKRSSHASTESSTSTASSESSPSSASPPLPDSNYEPLALDQNKVVTHAGFVRDHYANRSHEFNDLFQRNGRPSAAFCGPEQAADESRVRIDSSAETALDYWRPPILPRKSSTDLPPPATSHPSFSSSATSLLDDTGLSNVCPSTPLRLTPDMRRPASSSAAAATARTPFPPQSTEAPLAVRRSLPAVPPPQYHSPIQPPPEGSTSTSPSAAAGAASVGRGIRLPVVGAGGEVGGGSGVRKRPSIPMRVDSGEMPAVAAGSVDALRPPARRLPSLMAVPTPLEAAGKRAGRSRQRAGKEESKRDE